LVPTDLVLPQSTFVLHIHVLLGLCFFFVLYYADHPHLHSFPTRRSSDLALTHPDPAARPMMRWWWFGPDMDRAEIDRELRAMAEAGLGGRRGGAGVPAASRRPALPLARGARAPPPCRRARARAGAPAGRDPRQRMVLRRRPHRRRA